MTHWVMTLNETSPELEQLLSPTDTRLRADIRALDQGTYDKACTTCSLTHLKIAFFAVRQYCQVVPAFMSLRRQICNGAYLVWPRPAELAACSTSMLQSLVG